MLRCAGNSDEDKSNLGDEGAQENLWRGIKLIFMLIIIHPPTSD